MDMGNLLVIGNPKQLLRSYAKTMYHFMESKVEKMSNMVMANPKELC